MAEDNKNTPDKEVAELKAEEAKDTAVVEKTNAEVSTATTEDSAPAPKAKKKKLKRTVSAGQVHVFASFNNTIISFTDNKGGLLTASSAGACGFRGSKKGTAYAAQIACEKAGNAAKQQYGFSKAEVFVKGIGLGRESAVRTLNTLGIAVDSIKDVTGIAHGGVRPKKARRV